MCVEDVSRGHKWRRDVCAGHQAGEKREREEPEAFFDEESNETVGVEDEILSLRVLVPDDGVQTCMGAAFTRF